MTEPVPPTADIYLFAPANPGQHAPLPDFIEACAALRKTLRHVERCITGKDASLEFEVVGASVASMKLATAPANSTNPDVFARAKETVRVHRDTFAKLQNKRTDIDSRIDYPGLKAFEDFVPTLKRGKVVVAVDGIVLSHAFTETLNKALEPIKPAFGSVSGRVEKLDIHRRYSFVLFPPRAGVEVLCSFPPDKLSDVTDAINRHATITVYGLLHYGRGAAFPVSADVDDIEVHPPDDDLPSLLDMEGMMEGDDSSTMTGTLEDEWQ